MDVSTYLGWLSLFNINHYWQCTNSFLNTVICYWIFYCNLALSNDIALELHLVFIAQYRLSYLKKLFRGKRLNSFSADLTLAIGQLLKPLIRSFDCWQVNFYKIFCNYSIMLFLLCIHCCCVMFLCVYLFVLLYVVHVNSSR